MDLKFVKLGIPTFKNYIRPDYSNYYQENLVFGQMLMFNFDPPSKRNIVAIHDWINSGIMLNGHIKKKVPRAVDFIIPQSIIKN